MARRGTKSNPFDAGETVRVRRTGERGVVAEVKVEDIGLLYERSYSPVRYKVVFDPTDDGAWYSARDLVADPRKAPWWLNEQQSKRFVELVTDKSVLSEVEPSGVPFDPWNPPGPIHDDGPGDDK